MEKPTFSICIPNYNYAHYIDQTIQSILDQTYPHYEIVIVDNASTDDSIAVIQSFQSDKIRLYQNAYNVGFAPNLDRTAQKARNPYMIMLSSDDVMYPTALEEYARVIETLGDDAKQALIVSAYDVIDGEGTVVSSRNRENSYRIKPDPKLSKQFSEDYIEVFEGLKVFKDVFPRMGVPGCFCTTLYSRQLYDRVGGYSSVNLIGPDAHFAYKSLLQEVKVVYVNSPLFGYRVHGGGQLAKSKKTLKIPIDRYLFTLQYTDAELAKANVRREEIKRFLIDDSCLKGGFHELRLGSISQAFRFLMFGFASYPGLMFRNWKTYLLMMLLLGGPFAPIISRLLYKFFKS